MLYEYAVEPTVIAGDWKTCRYLSELFGFDRGRVLSQYPKKWLQIAIKAADSLPDVEKQRVIEKIRRLKEHASIQKIRDYDHDVTWVDNALRQQRTAPFHAIVVGHGVPGAAAVVEADDVSDTHRLFAIPRNIKIDRVAEQIVSSIAPLIVNSQRALFIDKYYDPFNARYQATLQKLLGTIASRPGFEFEIHYCEHSYCPDAASIEREVSMKFVDVIPAGMSIKLYRWAEMTGGTTFHGRYLLTDRGGVQIDAGFSSEGSHEQTDITLLESTFAQKTLALFKPSAKAYRLVGQITQIASDCSITHL